MAYSGNLYDLRSAIDKIRSLGFNVVTKANRAGVYYKEETLAVTTDEGIDIASKIFSQTDDDVMVTCQATWLNRLYEDLKTWN